MAVNKAASLSNDLLAIVRDKGTDPAYTGTYENLTEEGTYLCRQCGLALFRADSKFHSSCGWPSFDAEIANHVIQQVDADGRRREILCERCHAHLGHVFTGEQLTSRNTRYCVNSSSLDFVTDEKVLDTEEAILAAGCFWGVEYYFKQLKGVIKTEVGYSGGRTNYPNYEAVCDGNTGHYEVIRVLFDPKVISYSDVVKYFFEIHDPTDVNGQGPDIGEQYKSIVFYYDEKQKEETEKLIAELNQKGLKVASQVLPVKPFWAAEGFHQDYYSKTGKTPYCHRYVKRF